MLNEFNQPIGEPLPNFQVGERPTVTLLEGQYCRLEKLSVVKHQADLWLMYNSDTPAQNWTYLPEIAGSFEQKEDFLNYLHQFEQSADPYCFAIVDNLNNKALGTICLMSISPNNRSIEVGYVIFSDELKRSRIATEAQYLLMKYVFDILAYRRYEWRCDSLNAPSRRAAQRLGFTFEGVFRQAVVYRGRNRDTAWHSILDSEWLAIKTRFENWLAPSNFDAQGQQIQKLNP